MKKLLAVVLCLVMVLSLCVTAFATTAHGEHSEYTALTGATTELGTQSGTTNYVLNTDVEYKGSSNLSVTYGATVTICLNGHTLDMGDKEIYLAANSSKLTICDCSADKSGKIVTTRPSGPAIYNGSTVIIESGIIENESSGAAIKNAGTLSIKGGTVQSAGGYALSLSYINDNSESTDGDTYLSGAPTITGASGEPDIYTDKAVVFAKEKDGSKAYTGDNLQIEINSRQAYTAGEAIVKDVDDTTATKFELVSSNTFALERGTGTDENNLVLKEKPAASAGHAHAGSDEVYSKFTATSGNVVTGKYYLENDITATGMITIPSDVAVTLCLNGKTLDMGENYIEVKGTLTVCDCSNPSAGKITSVAGEKNHGTIRNQGTLTLESGLVECSSAGSYTLVRGVRNENNFTMTGGEVKGPTGIYNIETTYGAPKLTVAGGTVTATGNSTSAVYLDDGQLVIQGDPTFTGPNGDVALHKHGEEATSIKVEGTYSGSAIEIRLEDNDNPIADRTAPVVVGSADTNLFSLTDATTYVLKAEGGDLVLAEKDAATTYTVTLKANGGTGTDIVTTGITGNYTLPACTFTAPAGKQFKCWGLAADAKEGQLPGANVTLTDDTTLYVIWKLKVDDPESFTAGRAPTAGATVTIGKGVEGFETMNVKEVKVKDTIVAAANYEVTVSSLNITFKKAYLDTLAAGSYPVEITLDGEHAGIYQSTLTVDTATNLGGGNGGGNGGGGSAILQSPKTFDAGITLYATMALMSACGAAYVSKRR